MGDVNCGGIGERRERREGERKERKSGGEGK